MVHYFKHPTALVESTHIGIHSKIWAFTHVLAGAVIGKYSTICDHCFIEEHVSIGNYVTVKCGVYLWTGVIVEDNVMIGPAAVFTNDRFHRSKNKNFTLEKTILKKGCSIGANATIIAGNTIGEYALVGAGSVVSRSVPNYGLVYGNPARLYGFICSCAKKMRFDVKNRYECTCGKRYVKRNESTVERI